MDPRYARILRRLPPLHGEPIEFHEAPGLTDRHGPVHAGAFLRDRRIALNCTRAELPRILVHEVFHFAWLRAGNARRHSWEALLAAEFQSRATGELGWSAEWRKGALVPADRARRTRHWREYAAEAFCDTAAWLYSGTVSHPEFTLAERYRNRRRAWFEATIESRPLSI